MDESRLLCDGCARSNADLGSTDLATFGTYRLDASTSTSVPLISPWDQQTSGNYVFPSREGKDPLQTTGAVFATSAHQAAAPASWDTSIENEFGEQTPDWTLKQVFIPVDSYSVIEGPADFPVTSFGEISPNPFDDQGMFLEDHPGRFLTLPWQLKPLEGQSVSPIRQHVSDAHGSFEIPGMPDPNLQPGQHNVNPGRTAPSMSSGQSSLYQALLSLEYPLDESTTQPSASSSFSDSSPILTQPWPSTVDTSTSAGREDDPDGIVLILCGALPLDSRVESNSLPFVLQCYANWMKKMMFDPSRAPFRAREFIIRCYIGSTRSRFRMTLTANILRAVLALDVNYKPMLSILANDIRQTLIQSRSASVPIACDSDISLLSPLQMTLELNIISLNGPLHEALQIMGDIAPVIRRMCSEPRSQYIQLPSLLAHPDTNARGYPTIDILYSMLTGLPTQLKYDATLRPHSNRPQCTEPLGAWLIGQPTELTLILARISSLHDEFGLNVNPDVIEEIEFDIRDFKPDPGASADPSRTVTRLVVLEAWRQVGYINLYMRLYGESALGPRVQTAQRRLIDLIVDTKPSLMVNTHLAPCLGIAGLAATRAEERNLVLTRLQSLPHSREDSFLNRGLQMLQDIWMRTDSEGRPAQWSDLRTATRRIIGI